MLDDLTRRRFLQASTAATAATVLASGRVVRGQSPGDRIQVGLIGPGGMGNCHIHQLLKQDDVEIAAIADVDKGRLDAAVNKVEKGSGKKPQALMDYRKLLDMKEIVAVFNAAPDHWHAIPFIQACQAGKDV